MRPQVSLVEIEDLKDFVAMLAREFRDDLFVGSFVSSFVLGEQVPLLEGLK